jgi:hypothetical protein
VSAERTDAVVDAVLVLDTRESSRCAGGRDDGRTLLFRAPAAYLRLRLPSDCEEDRRLRGHVLLRPAAGEEERDVWISVRGGGGAGHRVASSPAGDFVLPAPSGAAELVLAPASGPRIRCRFDT